MITAPPVLTHLERTELAKKVLTFEGALKFFENPKAHDFPALETIIEMHFRDHAAIYRSFRNREYSLLSVLLRMEATKKTRELPDLVLSKTFEQCKKEARIISTLQHLAQIADRIRRRGEQPEMDN